VKENITAVGIQTMWFVNIWYVAINYWAIGRINGELEYVKECWNNIVTRVYKARGIR